MSPGAHRSGNQADCGELVTNPIDNADQKSLEAVTLSAE
jgi:hypothetical protein